MHGQENCLNCTSGYEAKLFWKSKYFFKILLNLKLIKELKKQLNAVHAMKAILRTKQVQIYANPANKAVLLIS